MKKMVLLLALLLFASTQTLAAEGVFKSAKFALAPAEMALPTTSAEPVIPVGNDGQTLEGAIFDKAGNLLFCDVSGMKVMRLSPDHRLDTVLQLEDMAPCGLAFHADGRLFICCIDQNKDRGAIIALAPDGKNIETILPDTAGYWPNDMVFDANGGFYFTDFKGSATRPLGGVYYISPDFGTVSSVIPDMGQANGVALSPDGRMLWATEYARNLLHRINLADPVTVPRTGSKIPYHFIGAAPDSMRVDADGNVYVAMVGQGRVMVFNDNGVPIGQIVLPGREKGLNLRSTSLAIHPEKKEVRIVAGNTADAASKDATIFSGPAFAKSQPLPAKKQ